MAFSSKNKFFTLEVCSLPKFETLKQQFGRKRWEHKNHLIIYLSYRMYQVCRLLLLSSIIFLNYFRPSSPPFCSICLPIGLKFVVPKFVFLFKANFWVHVLFTQRNYKSYPLSHVAPQSFCSQKTDFSNKFIRHFFKVTQFLSFHNNSHKDDILLFFCSNW